MSDQNELAKKSQSISALEEAEMAKYGIKRVPVDYFFFGKYRYSNLKDALAQAKRNQSKL
ncbi:hypothetical protein [Sneathiella limimaris]|uniref:hypothetical protein n=1 Tax=Sneathiella limimaris TaxID=1964213 RepID=UPI00146BD14A|nr:hypothetical protein [Sneathiella limimaris]